MECLPLAVGRSLRGNVDRNTVVTAVVTWWKSRSLRGNVDRNIYLINDNHPHDVVVPYVGTWIEMLLNVSMKKTLAGRSLRGNVDRNCI